MRGRTLKPTHAFPAACGCVHTSERAMISFMISLVPA